MLDSKTNLLGRLLSPKLASQQMEETKLMSDSEEVLPTMNTRKRGLRVDVMLNLLSLFMFFIGVLMVVSTLNYKQSDKACAAQLSIWCK